MNAVCFVVMPYGRKPDGMGGELDFDLIYQQLIQPAVAAAKLDAVRIDEGQHGGIIQITNFAALLKTDFAVFDVTTANPNVLYELGIRHAARPKTTAVIANVTTRLPFDLNQMRVIMYRLNAAGRPDETAQFSAALSRALRSSMQADSPIYQLFDSLVPPSVERIRTDLSWERGGNLEDWKQRVREARRGGAEELQELETELGDIATAQKSFVLALLDGYRAAGAWTRIIDLVAKMDRSLAATPAVVEQLALALDRTGRSEQAEQLLLTLISDKGPSSETYGILGRVYKDRWSGAKDAGEPRAADHLRKAIDSYVKGFETDWRDPYPGVNAVTLMDLAEPPDPRRIELLPIVLYGINRKIAAGRDDYWDHATLLELRILASDQEGAQAALAALRARHVDPWQTQTTVRNLSRIRENRERRGEKTDWIRSIEGALSAAG